MFGLGIVVVHAWKNSGFPWLVSLVPRVVHWWVGSAVLSAIYSYVHVYLMIQTTCQSCLGPKLKRSEVNVRVYLMIQYLLIQTTCHNHVWFQNRSAILKRVSGSRLVSWEILEIRQQSVQS